MKRFISVIISALLITTGVYAGEADNINYGYISPEVIVLNEGESTDSCVQNEPISYLGAYELPSKFDARDEGIIHHSGVGQYTDGTCWAFASTLCMETALGGKFNLSEQHAKYATSHTGDNPYGYIRSPIDGGNFDMYTAYAANWRGAVAENHDPYSYGYEVRDYKTVTAAKPVEFHLQGTVEIPNPAKKPSDMTAERKATHIQEVKKYIYTYGCVFSSVYWSSAYYNAETSAYYNSNPSTESNHAINLIGWDDDYPKENFKTQPQSDGAFIIKNSQGYEGVYAYLSYEDVFAGWDVGAITLAEDKYNYGEIYTHEYFQPGASITASKEAKTTNVFTSRYDGEFVSAVGVITKSRNLSCKVYLSTTGDGDDYTELRYTLCGESYLEMPGFHTIKLNKAFPLGNKGTKYCVRVVFESDDSFSIPLEYKTGTVQDTYAKEGESYLAYDNYMSSDMGKKFNANLYVKAYTDAEYSIKFITENASFSINGSEFINAEDTVAGLNDEITVKFTNPAGSYTINGTECTEDEYTLKVTEDIVITEEFEPVYSVKTENGTVEINTLTTSEESCTVSVSTDFPEEKTVIVAYYSHGTMVGIKSQKTTSCKYAEIETPVSEAPDSCNIIVIDGFDSLSTVFETIHFDI